MPKKKQADPDYTEQAGLYMLRHSSQMIREAEEMSARLQELLAALITHVEWVCDGMKAQQKSKAKAKAPAQASAH